MHFAESQRLKAWRRRMPRNIRAQSEFDAGLVAIPICGMTFEPVDHVSIKAQGQLLFDRTKKHTAPPVAPIVLFGNVMRVDLFVRQCGQSIELRALGCGERYKAFTYLKASRSAA